MKKIIINADDFGYSRIFNDVILELASQHMITGISIMVNYVIENSTKEQIKEVIKYRNILGLHVDFENIDLSKTNFGDEVLRQKNEFNKIFGFDPIFLDLHKLKYKIEGQSAIEELSIKNNFFYRKIFEGSNFKNTTSEKKIGGSGLSVEEIIIKIKKLPENSSVTIFFHPGKYDNNCKATYNREREDDTKSIICLNTFIESKKEEYEKIGYLELR